MTDHPYTDADLRTEAARQHYIATTDPDFMGIGEQMDDSLIDSTVVEPDDDDTGTAWGELPREQFDAAQRAIDDLLGDAADVSEWAIDLGADGLEPSGQQLTLGHEEPRVRIHFAFAPDMSEADRRDFVAQIAEAATTTLA